MRRRHIYWSVLLLALPLFAVLAGCGGDSESDASAPTTANISGGTPAAAGIARPASRTRPTVDLLHPKVLIETSVGRILIKLDAENAPGTVTNFLTYVNSGFYDQTCIHYVAPGDMILGGGFTTELEAMETAPAIRNEAHNAVSNKKGTIAMTRSLDIIDSSTSQFFINLVDHPNLDFKDETAEDYGYCVFGEVEEGLDVAEKISRVPTTEKSDMVSTPATPIVIKSIRQVN